MSTNRASTKSQRTRLSPSLILISFFRFSSTKLTQQMERDEEDRGTTQSVEFTIHAQTITSSPIYS